MDKLCNELKLNIYNYLNFYSIYNFDKKFYKKHKKKVFIIEKYFTKYRNKYNINWENETNINKKTLIRYYITIYSMNYLLIIPEIIILKFPKYKKNVKKMKNKSRREIKYLLNKISYKDLLSIGF